MNTIRAVVVAGLLGILPIQGVMGAYQVGDTVADFVLPDAYGNSVRLYSYQGMVVLINFWASW